MPAHSSRRAPGRPPGRRRLGGPAAPPGDLVAQVIDHVRGEIVSGARGPGTPLPSEGSLAESLAVARTVIRDRRGNIIEDVGATRPPRDGSDIALAIDAKIQSMGAARTTETRQLLFAALLLADEVHEAKSRSGLAASAPPGQSPLDDSHAERLEAIAAKLEACALALEA